MQAVTLQNCDVYSYKGDGDLDPLSKSLQAMQLGILSLQTGVV